MVEFLLEHRPQFKWEIKLASFKNLQLAVKLVKESDEFFKHGPNEPQLRALKKRINKPWSLVSPKPLPGMVAKQPLNCLPCQPFTGLKWA